MNKLLLTAVLTLAVIFSSEAKSKCCKKNSKKTHAACTISDSVTTLNIQTGVDTVSYFLGSQIGADMLKNGVNDINTKLFEQGMKDAISSSPLKLDSKLAMAYTQAYFEKKQEEMHAAEEAKSKQFIDSIAQLPNVKTTASGLRYEILKDTIGEKPSATDKVTVHYTGKLTNGDIFDSSVERGEPATFPLNAVIKGWTEGVQLMSVGSKYRFYIPGNLAYGEQGVPQAGIGHNATLIFDVELLGIEKPKPQVPQAPSNMMIEGQ